MRSGAGPTPPSATRAKSILRSRPQPEQHRHRNDGKIAMPGARSRCNTNRNPQAQPKSIATTIRFGWRCRSQIALIKSRADNRSARPQRCADGRLRPRRRRAAAAPPKDRRENRLPAPVAAIGGLPVAIDFRCRLRIAVWCCTEIARRHGDFAIVAVAVLLGCGRDRRIDFARVALGGVGPAPLRMIAAEQALLGERPGAELFRGAGDVAAQAVDPPADITLLRVTGAISTGVLVRRALTTAASRVKGRASVTEMISITLKVNGSEQAAAVEPRRSLVDFLRYDLGLVGTHVGLRAWRLRRLHGDARRPDGALLLLFAAQADGSEVTTSKASARTKRSILCSWHFSNTMRCNAAFARRG